MGLSMKTQVAAKIEDSEGVAATLTAAELLQSVLAGPAIEEDQNEIDRDLARESLTHPEAIPGLRGSRFPIQLEAAGPTSGFPSTQAQIGTLLRACGMRLRSLRRSAISASWSSGSTILDGETFTAAPSGATGKVWGDYVPSDAYIFYEVTTGSITSSDTLTFSGGAVVSAGNPVINQSCAGWRPEDVMLSQIQVASVTNGPILAGEELLGGTSGARAVCRQDTSGAGTQNVVFERLTGGGHFVAGETITVPGTSKSATVSGGVVETQSQIPSLTLAALHDGVIKQHMKGARGSWSVRLKNGDRAVFSFNFTGCGMKPVDSNLLTWPGTTVKTPPVVTGGLFSIDRTFLPYFSELSLDMGNEVALRESPNDSGGSGYESAHIVARRPRGSIDPEVVRESVKPLFGAAWDKTTFRLLARVGLGLADGNTFEFRCRKAQARVPRVAERNRIRTYAYDLLLNGDGDDEILIFEW